MAYPITSGEQELEKVLEEFSGYVSLSLHPPFGERSPVNHADNECKINEGRDGRFFKISMEFYHSMVDKYDSRYS